MDGGMTDLTGVLSVLNAPPFSRNLTLVSLDSLSPSESLQLLNDVFADLDKAHRVDVRDEPSDVAAARMVNFLSILKFPGEIADGLGAALARGDRAAVYPALAYVCARLPALRKRAYVARFLLPVDVPPEVGADDALAGMLADYRALQSEFKETHKALEKASASSLGSGSSGGGGADGGRRPPAELKRDIAQLEDERGQLIERIAALKKKTAELRGFAPLLDATSSLRKEQEEEGRISERAAEQRMLLTAAERRYGEVAHRLAETHALVREDQTTGGAVLASARREAAEGRTLLSGALPASIEARRETLGRLRRMLAEPPKSDAALAELRALVASTEAAVVSLTSAVAEATRAAGDSKLAMFRQQSALVTKKLAQKEEMLVAAQREAEAAAREVEAREAKLSELSGPKYMKRDEFKAYATALRTKTTTFKTLKAALGEARQESVVLSRTEALLRARATDIDAFMRKLEEKKGIAGYTGIASSLEEVSALKSRIDESKGKTLEEIARIVSDIQSAIAERKTRLAPQMTALRSARTAFAEMEMAYVHERAKYENVASGLESEKSGLERTADALAADATAEEGRAALCAAQGAIVDALIARANDEAAFEAGEGRFVRDFKTQKELFANKLAQVRGRYAFRSVLV